MKTFDARREVVKFGKPFATSYGAYELRYEPHLLGPMIHVSSKLRDDTCGTYLLSDAPLDFIVALGAAARLLGSQT